MNVKKNLLFNTLYQLLNIIVPLITSPYLSRVVGAEGIGIYAYYNSIAYYFILFMMLGLNNYGNRTIARVREEKENLSKCFCNIYCIQLITGIIGIALYLFLVLIFIDENQLVGVINIIYVVSALFDINWFFSGLEKFKIIVVRNSLFKLVSLICILIFVKQKSDLPIYIFIMSISTLLSQISIWPFLKKEVTWIKPTWIEIKKHIKPNFILFVPVIAVSLYKIMDKIMIGFFSTKVQVGYYENSEKIINIPQALINSLGTVMLPRITNLLAKGEYNQSKRYTRDSMQYAMALSIGASFGLIGISSNFSVWFFGNEFKSCGILIAFLAPTIIFNAWANVIRTQYLIPMNKDKSYIISVVAGAIVNLCINGALIGKMGALGAVIGTIFAELTVTIIQTIYVYKDIEILTYVKDNCFFVISGLIMCILIKHIAVLGINGFFKLLIQIISGLLVYILISLLIFRVWDKKRLKYLINSICHRK